MSWGSGRDQIGGVGEDTGCRGVSGCGERRRCAGASGCVGMEREERDRFVRIECQDFTSRGEVLGVSLDFLRVCVSVCVCLCVGVGVTSPEVSWNRGSPSLSPSGMDHWVFGTWRESGERTEHVDVAEAVAPTLQTTCCCFRPCLCWWQAGRDRLAHVPPGYCSDPVCSLRISDRGRLPSPACRYVCLRKSCP